MTIEEIIQKAIEGGWNPTEEKDYTINTKPDGVWTAHFYDKDYPEEGTNQYEIQYMVLDPKFWEAVGKVEGWKEMVCEVGNSGGYESDDYYTEWREASENECDDEDVLETRKGWEHKMHDMIDALCSGQSIEDFIKSL